MDSILNTIKKLLGIPEEYDHFDPDLIVCINSAILGLLQIGVGPEAGFAIEGDGDSWSSLCGTFKNLEAVKSYIHLKVRLLFDPPASAALIEAIGNQIKEIEWRLCEEVESMHR